MVGDDDFWLIAVTPETPVADEAEKICALIDAGWTRVHLRHPSADPDTVAAIIQRLPMAVRRSVSAHDYFQLAELYRLGGIHLNRRNGVAPYGWRGVVSISIHSLDEVPRAEGKDYFTLSPFFDSISKPGYQGRTFARVPDGTRCIPLGGITPDKIKTVRSWGFRGAAMLGAIPWQGSVEEVYQFATDTLSLC